MAKKPATAKMMPFFSVIRVDGGWSFVKIETNENYEVISRVESQPDMKAIAQEAFKIAVGNYWGKME